MQLAESNGKLHSTLELNECKWNSQWIPGTQESLYGLDRTSAHKSRTETSDMGRARHQVYLQLPKSARAFFYIFLDLHHLLFSNEEVRESLVVKMSIGKFTKSTDSVRDDYGYL